MGKEELEKEIRDLADHLGANEGEMLVEVTKLVRLAEQRLIEKVRELLHDKSELVTYKKDGGHGVAVPMSVVFDLDQLAGEEGKDERE